MPPSDRWVILAEGHLDVFSAKTATGILRYRAEQVVAVLDRAHAGGSLQDLLGVSSNAPVVATLEETLAHDPTALVIGIAPPGGQLPETWRPVLRQALAAGMDLISGLHCFLADDPELAELARQSGAAIVDLRRPPRSSPIATGRAGETRAKRVLTVGTDCNLGKMTVSLEIAAAARAAALDARFLATGQTGMAIAGGGIPLDCVTADFMAGIVEEAVLSAGDCDWLLVEGQGSILHPAFSGVSIALLHGALPDCMILCHQPGRNRMRNQNVPIPPLNDWITLYERMLRPLHPGRIVGVALNCHRMSDEDAREAVWQVEEETGLPCTDVLRYGAERLVSAIRQSGLQANSSV